VKIALMGMCIFLPVQLSCNSLSGKELAQFRKNERGKKWMCFYVYKKKDRPVKYAGCL